MSLISPIVHLVQNTARYQTPNLYRMPPTTWAIFTTLHKIHQCWRWIRKAEIYSNPQNFQNLLAGHAVNWIVGDKLLIRIAAHCVLIMTRILACVEGQIAVHRAYQDWINSLKMTHSRHRQWKTYHEIIVFSPSVVNRINSTKDRLVMRIQEIMICSLCLVGELFILSMSLMEAIEAFSLNPQSRQESINEVFVNSNYSIDQLIENKELMVSRLKHNKRLVEMILTGIGTTYKVEQLIEAVEGAINIVEDVQNVVKFSDMPTNFGKRVFLEIKATSRYLTNVCFKSSS